MATLTTTPIKTFVSGDTVTPAGLNELAQSAVALTAGTIVNADISASAAIALSKLATGALPTSITVASANIVDGTIVEADIANSAVTTAKIADANVTTAKLATVTAQALLPAGAVMAFAMNSAPSGWLAADGTAVSRSTYAALFAAIGTTHGAGNGSTTFNLPDLRGIFVRGSGSQTISGTAYSGTFAEKQNATQIYDQYELGRIPDLGNAVFNSDASTTRNVQVTSNVSFTGGTPTISRTFSSARPANIALLYCIKF